MVFLFCPSYWIVGTGYSLELHRTNGVEYSGTACYHSQPFKWALAGFGSIICFGHEKSQNDCEFIDCPIKTVDEIVEELSAEISSHFR